MAKLSTKKYWWVVVVVIGVLAMVAMGISGKWMPKYTDIVMYIGMALIGSSFLWAYAIDTKKNWWAIIPGLAIFVLLIAVLADIFIGIDTTNDWINLLITGVGVVVIALVVRHKNAKITLHIVALFCLCIGFAMAPFTWLIKGITIGVVAIAYGFLIWRIWKK